MTISYTPSQIADGILAGEITRDSAFVPLAEVERLRAENARLRAQVAEYFRALMVARLSDLAQVYEPATHPVEDGR